jgi:hypothetical protein
MTLAGLQVKLPQPCQCKCAIARIANGEWKNPPLICDQCGRIAGCLAECAQEFLGQAIKLWGRPPTPIVIRKSNMTETSVPPPGAGAQDVNQSAPLTPNLRGLKCKTL